MRYYSLIIAFLCGWRQVSMGQVAPDSGSWSAQATGFAGPFYCMSAVNRNVCLLGGPSGRIIRTTDGGDTWALVQNNHFPSEGIYIIAGCGDSIVLVGKNDAFGFSIKRTTNSGTSWTDAYWQLGGTIRAIHMQGRHKGIALCEPDSGTWMFLRTTDDGASWSRIAIGPPQTNGEVWGGGFQTFDTTHIWFGSSLGRVYFTTDGGLTWNWSFVGFPPYGNLLWFNSQDVGLTAWTTWIFRTTDSGTSWASVLNPNVSGKTGLVGALRSTEFWLLSGGIYYSPNAGDSWAPEPPHGLNKIASLIDMVTEGQNVFAWARGISGDTVYHYERILTHVDEKPNQEPSSFALEQNYPNPFNPSTRTRFSVPPGRDLASGGQISDYGLVTLKVFDLLGREVATLVNEVKVPGAYTVQWDAGNLASGVYICRLESGALVQSRKLLLLR